MRSGIKVLQVIHSLTTAGTEKLVCDMIKSFSDKIQPYVCCLDELGALSTDLIKKGIPVFCINRKPGYDLTAVYKIAGISRQNKIDIIHAHQYTPYFYSVLSRLLRPKTKIFFTEHGRHYPDINKFSRKVFNRVFNSITNEITAVSEFAKSRLVTNEAFPSYKIEVIYNGVDLKRFNKLKPVREVKDELKLGDNNLIIGFIGRFHWVKDPRMLIKAFSIVQAEIPNARLVMVGGGEILNECREFASSLNLDDKIIFTGERSDVLDLLQVFDVFALPSLIESTSVSLIEAMLSGLPVVATNVGGNPEIVREKITGILCSKGDYKHFAETLKKLLKNTKMRMKMGEHARKIAIECYEMQQMTKSYERIYEELMN